jgi:hypothetical protein
VYPTQTYYFNDGDSVRVDEIVKELQLITSPYMDYKPFFKKELIIVAIVVIITLIALVFVM